MTTTLNIYADENADYKPRPWQANFEKQIGNRKRAFLLWARRHGKDIACWNYLILQAIHKRGAYYHLYPRQNQARKAIWEGMTSTGKRFLDYIPRELLAKPPNSTEMLITLINGSIIRIMGSDNYDAFRSSNPIGVVLSEFAWHHPDIWPTVIEPILRENKGWALFNTTPFGKNHASELYEYAVQHPELWYTEKVTNEDSGMIAPEEFEEMRKRGVSEDIIQGEYFCDWNRGVEGAYYAKIINTLRLDGRIRPIARDDYALVHSSWDLGFGDSCSLWLYQLINNEIYVIDFYESNGEGVAHYVNILEEKRREYGYKYGTHFVPHDAQNGSMLTGSTLIKAANDLGLKMTVLERDKLDFGIQRVRKYLPKCHFDINKTEYGLKCLEGYRKKYNEKMKYYSDTPLHDFCSHAADSFRYLCQAVEIHQSGSSIQLNEYRAMKKAYGIGGRFNNNSILGN